MVLQPSSPQTEARAGGGRGGSSYPLCPCAPRQRSSCPVCTSCRWSIPGSTDGPSLAGRSARQGFSPGCSRQCLYPLSLAAPFLLRTIVPAWRGGSAPAPALALAGWGLLRRGVRDPGEQGWGAVAVHSPGGSDSEPSRLPRGWISLICVLARGGGTGVSVPAAQSCRTP